MGVHRDEFLAALMRPHGFILYDCKVEYMAIDSVPERYGPLCIRLALGAIMIVHGAGKALGVGPAASSIPGFADSLAGMGLPAPLALAWIVALVEFGGGLAVLSGVFTRVAAAAVAADMFAAVMLAHLSNGFLVSEGGYEFALLLGLAALSLVVTGAGALSVTGALFGSDHRIRQLS